MDVKITPSNKYMLELDGKPAGEFNLVNSWEGMSMFRDHKGNSIIVDGIDTTTSLLKSIFSQNGEVVGTMIKISPNLMLVARAGESE